MKRASAGSSARSAPLAPTQGLEPGEAWRLVRRGDRARGVARCLGGATTDERDEHDQEERQQPEAAE